WISSSRTPASRSTLSSVRGADWPPRPESRLAVSSSPSPQPVAFYETPLPAHGMRRCCRLSVLADAPCAESVRQGTDLLSCPHRRGGMLEHFDSAGGSVRQWSRPRVRRFLGNGRSQDGEPAPVQGLHRPFARRQRDHHAICLLA